MKRLVHLIYTLSFMIICSYSFAQKETPAIVERAQLTIIEGKTKVSYDYKSFEDLLKFSPILIKEALRQDKKKKPKKNCGVKVSFTLTRTRGGSSESLNSTVSTDCGRLIEDVSSVQKDLIELLRKD